MANLQQSVTAESVPSQKVKTRKPSDDYLRGLPWAFLAPALLIYSMVVVYPMVYSAYLSLFRWDGISPTKVLLLLPLAGFLPGNPRLDHQFERPIAGRSICTNKTIAAVPYFKKNGGFTRLPPLHFGQSFSSRCSST